MLVKTRPKSSALLLLVEIVKLFNIDFRFKVILQNKWFLSEENIHLEWSFAVINWFWYLPLFICWQTFPLTVGSHK